VQHMLLVTITDAADHVPGEETHLLQGHSVRGGFQVRPQVPWAQQGHGDELPRLVVKLYMEHGHHMPMFAFGQDGEDLDLPCSIYHMDMCHAVVVVVTAALSAADICLFQSHGFSTV